MMFVYHGLGVFGFDRVLDVGCGDIPFFTMSSLWGRVVNFDIESSDNVHVVGDGVALPFKDKVFELVTSFGVFYADGDNLSLENGKLHQAMKEICRVGERAAVLYSFVEEDEVRMDTAMSIYFKSHGTWRIEDDIFNYPQVTIRKLIYGVLNE
jgi:hypothetical protein